eukprot:6201027-Pleurochrysis_carterae.AAC.7
MEYPAREAESELSFLAGTPESLVLCYGAQNNRWKGGRVSSPPTQYSWGGEGGERERACHLRSSIHARMASSLVTDHVAFQPNSNARCRRIRHDDCVPTTRPCRCCQASGAI